MEEDADEAEERGGVGATTVELWNLNNPDVPILIEAVTWKGTSDVERNKFQFEIDGSNFKR